MTNESNYQQLTKAEYATLAQFRRALRNFLRFSELAARQVGLTPQQHQLLLTIKGIGDREWATVSEIAAAMQLNHNAAVQLVDRAQAMDLVTRTIADDDRRVVHVEITAAGTAILAALTTFHHEELRRLRDNANAIPLPLTDDA